MALIVSGLLKGCLLLSILFALGFGYQGYYLYQRQTMAWTVPVPTVAELGVTYGNEKGDLNHQQTRDLYHRVMQEQGEGWLVQAAGKGAPKNELAHGCSWLRWRARLYARERDGENAAWTATYLAVRDMLVHAWSRRSTTAMLDTLPCLILNEDYPCPSYANLFARKGSDDKIIESCFRSNAYYDKFSSKGNLYEPSKTTKDAAKAAPSKRQRRRGRAAKPKVEEKNDKKESSGNGDL